MWHERLKSIIESIEDRQSLRQQIGLLSAVLGTVIVLALAVAAATVGRERALQHMAADTARLAAGFAQTLDRHLEIQLDRLHIWSQLAPLQQTWNADPERLRPLLEQLRSGFPEYAWIGFADAGGVVRAATGGLLEGGSVAMWPAFRASLRSPASEREVEENGRYLDIAFPVLDTDGQLIGALGARLDRSWAEALRRAELVRSDLAAEGDIWLLSAAGEILVGPSAGRKAFSAAQLEDVLAPGRVTLIDDAGVLNGFARLRGEGGELGRIVVARRPVHTAYVEGREVGLTVMLVGFVVLLLGVAAAVLVAGRLAAPIRVLAGEADRIGRDPAVTMLPRERGSRELLQLSSALRSLFLRLGLDERVAGEEEAVGKSESNVQAAGAGIDPLTGLMRRHAFMTHAEDAMRYYQRYARNIATLVVDIDHFRRTNEAYSRAAGDAVMRRVSELIEQTVRSTDKVARLGGDGFVVLLREIDEEQTQALAERLRKKVESAAIIHGSDAIGVTASIGAAVVSRQDRDVEDLIERADRALYWAKSAGRNCVRLAPAAAESPVERAA